MSPQTHAFSFATDRCESNSDMRFDPLSGAEMPVSYIAGGIASPEKEPGEGVTATTGASSLQLGVLMQGEQVGQFEIEFESVGESEGATRSFEDGLILHDPNRGLFTADVLSGSAAGLPWPYDGTEPSLPESVPKADESLNIFLIFQTTPDERQTIQSVIQQAVDQAQASQIHCETKPTVHLIQWEHNYSPSRHDIIRMWTTYTQHVNRTDSMHFLEFLSETDVSKAQFITIYDNESYPLIIARNSLDAVVEEALGSSTRLSHVDSPHFSQLSDIELLHPPDTSFAPNPFPWKSPDRRAIDIPLFYLTHDLTIDQKRNLKSEIQTITYADLDDELKVCCFVPWTPTPDFPALSAPNDNGLVARIWSILFEMQNYKLADPEFYIEPPYFFIDAQSGLDQTVIAMYTNRYSDLSALVNETETESAHDILSDITDPPISGFMYGRIRGRYAHNLSANLSIANTGLKEIFEGREEEIVRVSGPRLSGLMAGEE
ncbi:hypothetical protein BJX68DRAFT_269946 [Aspergillus pseudodeflectus]|uniref:Uncharacterized protein n=1 Tax=Aspergillus pseudodeflectus TaxID=176178 RepID=A0ABR4JUP2_9EURO